MTLNTLLTEFEGEGEGSSVRRGITPDIVSDVSVLATPPLCLDPLECPPLLELPVPIEEPVVSCEEVAPPCEEGVARWEGSIPPLESLVPPEAESC